MAFALIHSCAVIKSLTPYSGGAIRGFKGINLLA